MGGKGGQGLFDALLIADVRKDLAKDGNFAFFRRRDHQPAHGHQSQQSDCFQRDGFAPRVRPRDDQRIKADAKLDVRRHNRRGINQRMPRLFQHDPAMVVDFRQGCLHPVGEVCFGKDHIELHRRAVAADDRVGKVAGFCGKLCQDPLDFFLFLQLKHPYLIVQFHGVHRLDKQRRSASGRVVNQAGHLAPVLCPNRDDKAAAPDGDDRILQIFLISCGPRHPVQHLPRFRRGCTDLPPDSL